MASEAAFDEPMIHESNPHSIEQMYHVPENSKRATLALANLFLYSVAMFTLPFLAFYGTQYLLTNVWPVEGFARTAWSVAAAVVMTNIIVFAYAYKAYHEKEFDDEGNEIDQHVYPPPPAPQGRSELNLKED